ncbi:MAG: hypothetical protein DRI90_26595 [Deltaproteobacteria bacterium]|nr:MAG: hypothetical protein DRI90_26595 [Deltaproteobacteria bacterium]
MPVRANVRAGDVDPRGAKLMASAGVREVLIGQESGDQRLLNAMRKGARVNDLWPALEALAAQDLNADVSFIVGFPGEDEESLRLTRRMLLSLNDRFEQRPVVLSARVIVFEAQAFAAVAQRDGLSQLAHPFAYQGPIDAARAERERLDMFIATSRKASAPISNLNSRHMSAVRYAMVTMGEQRYEIFRWLKAIERGVSIYLEQSLHDTKPNPRELDQIRGTIMSRYDPAPKGMGLGQRLRHSARKQVTARLASEWQKDTPTYGNVMTRLLLAAQAGRTTGRIGPVCRTALTGKYPHLGGANESPSARRRRETLADAMVEQGGDVPPGERLPSSQSRNSPRRSA